MAGSNSTTVLIRNGQEGASLAPNGDGNTSKELLYAAERLTDKELVDAVQLSVPGRLRFKALAKHVGVEFISYEGKDLRIHSHLFELSRRLDVLFEQLTHRPQRILALVAAYKVLASAGLSGAIHHFWHSRDYHKKSTLSAFGLRLRKPTLDDQTDLFYSMCRALGNRSDTQETTALRAILAMKLIKLKGNQATIVPEHQ